MCQNWSFGGAPPDTSKKPKGGKTLDMVKRGMVRYWHGRKGRIVWDSSVPAGDGNWGKWEWKMKSKRSRRHRFATT